MQTMKIIAKESRQDVKNLVKLTGRLRMFVQLCKTQNDGLLRAYVRCIVGLQNTKMSLKSGLHR